jgi:hypothetical protein
MTERRQAAEHRRARGHDTHEVERPSEKAMRQAETLRQMGIE